MKILNFKVKQTNSLSHRISWVKIFLIDLFLGAGYIQSYVDFFYITNSSVPKVFKTAPNMNINDYLVKYGFNVPSRFENNEDELSELK